MIAAIAWSDKVSSEQGPESQKDAGEVSAYNGFVARVELVCVLNFEVIDSLLKEERDEHIAEEYQDQSSEPKQQPFEQVRGCAEQKIFHDGA